MLSSKGKAERTAAQAWDYLSSAMATAGESAKEAGKQTAGAAGDTAVKLAGRAGRKSQKLADKAGRKGHKLADSAGQLADKAGSKADEAWARASAAADALAGRRPGRPWGMIAGATLIGVALGWAAAGTVRAALERQAENEQIELAETAVVVTPFDD